MATLLLTLLLSQEEPVKAENVWKGADWKGSHGGPLIRTRAEWAALWKGNPAPDIDFEKSLVLAIFCGGYGEALGLEEVGPAPGGTVIVYSDPAKGVITGMPFKSTAYLLIQFPKRAEKIALKVRWHEMTGKPKGQVRTDDDPRLEERRRTEARDK